ncbi:hypothetical protein LUZ60_013310 [Juncus effusus]|nr:hypothetical protein LUZ60_013310 [Juncus effusus]
MNSLISALQIVAIAFATFFLFFALASSIRWLHDRHVAAHNRPKPPEPIGLDPTVISTLPMYRYTCRDGYTVTPECAICLSEVSEGEEVRLLPVCTHLFHKVCIETWLMQNWTCPVCRARVRACIVSDIEIQ